MKKHIAAICIFFLIIQTALASVNEQHKHEKPVVFIQNKGQWEANIQYRADIHGGALFAESDRITIVLQDVEKAKKIKEYTYQKSKDRSVAPTNAINMHVYTMNFVGSKKEIRASGKSEIPTYFNYFIGKDSRKWASKVSGFEGVKYEELYSGIDFHLYSQESNIKYDFLVSPGANTDSIRIRYDGAFDVRLKEENLIITTSVNEVKEMKPKAWQEINGEIVYVQCNYKLLNNTVSFEFPNGYDKSQALIIDPILIFASYSGSYTDNWGFTATYDDNGFLYSGSLCFSISYPSTPIGLFPTTPGAYSTTFSGGKTDIGISKYDTTGDFMVYSTYLGGDSVDLPHSLVINKKNELVLFGTTDSPDFPTTPNAYSRVLKGGTYFSFDNDYLPLKGTDIIVSKLSPDGSTLLASTYFGGTGNDGVNASTYLVANYADEIRGEVEVDDNNNVFVVTSTLSTDLPTTPGVFQPNSDGLQEGCIVKFDEALSSVIWCSYLGGSKDDGIYAFNIDKTGDIVVAGGTTSPDFFVTGGVVQPVFGGGTLADGFITKIRQNGTAILNSTYWGTASYDQTYLIETDKNNFIYVFGQTKTTTSKFISNALWNMPGGGQMISKFNPSLSSVVWSTTFGKGNGQPDISPSAFMVDLCKSIYLSGWGGSVNQYFIGGNTYGLPITADAFQKTTDGSDYYLMVLKDDASAMTYGSYFGGPISAEHVDGGTSRFDRKGRIYQSVCAGCWNNDDFPTNTLMKYNNSTGCNNGVFKFDFLLPAVIADFKLPKIGCAPYSVAFENTSTGADQYFWNFGDGQASTLKNPTHVYLNPGNYTIQLIAKNTNTCNTSDTIAKKLLILSNSSETLPPKSLCRGTGITIGYEPNADTSVHYIWSPVTGLNNPTLSNPIASPVQTTTYVLTVTNSICISEVTQVVTVYDISVAACPDTIVCSSPVHLYASHSGSANSFIWSLDDKFKTILNSNTSNSSASVPVVKTETMFYLHASDNQCDAYDSVKVSFRKPNIQIQPTQTICSETSKTLLVNNLISTDNVNWQWQPNSFILSGGNSARPVVSSSVTTKYLVLGTNQYGCVAADSITINATRMEADYTKTSSLCQTFCNAKGVILPSFGTPPYKYAWSNGTTDSIDNALCPGNYTVTVSDYLNCSKLLNFDIANDNYQPPVSASVDLDTIYPGQRIHLYATPPSGYTYLWNPEENLNNFKISSPIATPYNSTDFRVIVTDSLGCTNEAFVKVHVLEINCKEPDIYLPNAFSPNNDNENDVLYVRGNIISDLHLAIFNRWGEKVFETFDQAIGWDGSYKGMQVDPGVFVYYLDVKCVDKQSFFKKGNITLFR